MNRLFYCSAFVILQGIFLACSNIAHDDASTSDGVNVKLPDTIAYKLFVKPDNTYGFDITINGKIFIHQPVIPASQGVKGFFSADAAASVAKMITSRLESNNYSVLISEYEIDSLLKMKMKPKKNVEIVDDSVSKGFAPILNTPDNNNQYSFPETLPSLPNAPIKSLWTRMGIVPFGQRYGVMSFSIRNSIYMGGGQIKDVVINDFWSYDASKNWWTCLAFMPGGSKLSGIGFAINGKGYIGLGTDRFGLTKNFKNDLYEYDPAGNTWRARAPFIGSARMDASSFCINGKAYVGTGFSGITCNDFYEYDPKADHWKRIADFGGGPVSASIGISTGTRVFIVAGAAADNKKFVYEYLPAVNRWDRKKDIPAHPRYFAGGWNIDDNLLIAGLGQAEGGAYRFRDLFLYNCSANTWDTIPGYPVSNVGNSRLTGSNVNGKIFCGTGFSDFYLNDWNVFEYYYSVRTDTGAYDEAVCYPLKYDGNWQLYEECTGDGCYAGAAIKTSEKLGDFCYKSYLCDSVKQLSLQNAGAPVKNFIILPRMFNISSQKKPDDSVGLRLFFTKEEIEKFAAHFEKITGKKFNSGMIKILQCDNKFNLQQGNKSMERNDCTIISPQLYGYGFKQQTFVTSFDVKKLASDFYLAIQIN